MVRHIVRAACVLLLSVGAPLPAALAQPAAKVPRVGVRSGPPIPTRTYGPSAPASAISATSRGEPSSSSSVTPKATRTGSPTWRGIW